MRSRMRSALTGVLIGVLALAGMGRAAEMLRDGYAGQGFGTAAVYGDDDTAQSRILVDKLTVTNTAVLSGPTTISGAATINQAVLRDGNTLSSSSATNGQAITLSGIINVLNSVNGEDNGTNTVTLVPVAAGVVGRMFVVINGGTSNNLSIAQTGTWASPVIDLAPKAAAWVIVGATNLFYGGGL